jgi:flagellar biosynthesis protein FlhF
MKIKRFFAADIRQAMRMVKDELGADAVIMSNRAVDGGIEIVAARDFDEQMIHNKLQEQTVAVSPQAGLNSVVFPTLDTAKKRAPSQDNFVKPMPAVPASAQKEAQQPITSPVVEKPQEPAAPKVSDFRAKRVVLPNFDAAKKRLQQENERKQAEALIAKQQNEKKFTSPYVGYAEKAQLIKETEALVAKSPAPQHGRDQSSESALNQANFSENLLKEMSAELKHLRSAMDSKFANISWALNPQATSLRNDINQRLLDMGISKKLSATVADQLADESDVESAFVKAQDMLSNALPIANDKLLETGGIVALVGPTGVGKTTTIAKLAAKFILKHGASQVALITTDNYRIGAHEQLNTYGRILNVPVRVASCPDDLRNIINGFANKRLILIDTAGMCQRDMKLIEQINTLQQNDLPIRSYLVMSATTEYKAMKEIIHAFSVFEPQAAILTKLDEAVMTGPALSSIIEHNLPLSFIADGQQVPEDFHQPNAHALMQQCVANAETDDEDEQGYQSWGAQAYA